MGISVFPPASGGITTRTLRQEVFNTSGTWTYPTSSRFDGTVFVTAVGGGGAGGGAKVGGGSGPVMLGGGGGGGRVIIDREINVLNGGNQTVTIGAGGVSNISSGFGEANGGYTIFGSPVIGNYYPDPNMRKGLIAMSQSTNYPDDFFSSDTTSYPNYVAPYATDNTNSQGPKSGMDSTEWAVLTNGANNYSLYFNVPPSTAMRLFFRHTPTGTSGTVTPFVHFYDANNVFISSSQCSQYTVSATGGSFTLYSDTSSVTSPANARFAMIRFSGNRGGITDLTLSPASAGLSAPVSGNTSGWTWAGSPDNSWTVRSTGTNLANYLIAQGGGSGWGALRTQNGQAIMRCTGSSGWSAGGHACVDDGSNTPSNQSLWFLAGHGGGSDEDAVNFSLMGDWSFGNVDVKAEALPGGTFSYSRWQFRTTSGSANREYFRPFHAGGMASQSIKYTSYNQSNFHIIDYGRPGKSTSGYGAGGVGSWFSPVSGDSTFPGTVAASRTVWREGFTSPTGVEANTGNGGAGVYASSVTVNGQNGSSGLVIVRWYE